MSNYYSLGPHLPELCVEIAMISDADDTTQVWTDIGQDVLSINTRRGRSDELGRAEAGTMSIRLRNWMRRYDPALGGGTNLVLNPWMEFDGSGWASPDTIARSSDQQLTGTHSMKVTCQSNAHVLYDSISVITANKDYTMGMWVYIPAAADFTAADAYLRLEFENYDNAPGLAGEKVIEYNSSASWRDKWQLATMHVTSITDLNGFLAIKANNLPDPTIVYADHAFFYGAPSNMFGDSIDIMKRIRVKARFGGTEYDVWSGIVTSMRQVWNGTGQVPEVEFDCVDLFRILALTDLELTETAVALTGARIDDRLDDSVWPSGDRAIDSGHQTMSEQAEGVRNVLSEIQAAAEAERGIFFVAGNGDATFLDGLHKLQNSTVSQVTFTDMYAGTEAQGYNGALMPGFDASTVGYLKEGTAAIAWAPNEDHGDKPWSGSLHVTGADSGSGMRTAWNTNYWNVSGQGTVYEITAWIKPDVDAVLRMTSYEYLDTVYQVQFHAGHDQAALANVWTRLYHRFTVTGATVDRVRIDVDSRQTGLNFYVDDIMCTIEWDTGNLVQYEGLQPELDDARLANDIIVTYANGTATASDSTSKASYMIRTRSISTELAYAGGAEGYASSELYWHKDPEVRFPRIDVETANDGDNTIADILGLEIWDRATVKRTPPLPQTTYTQTNDVYVEGISHNITIYDWRTSFDLSPADDGTKTFLEMDEATDGKLGSGNCWAPV